MIIYKLNIINMKAEKFTIKSRIRSFGYAINGLKIVFKNEHNFRIHTFAAFAVLIAGFIFKVSVTEWIILTLTIAFVMVVEALNTAIEYVCNYLTKDYDYNIGVIKDVCAAAVLISAIGAAIVGIIIFAPKIFEIFISNL